MKVVSEKKPVKVKPEGLDLIKQYKSGFKFWIGMLTRLPSAVFWGIRIKHLDTEQCQVTIPFNWRTKNPFKSIYFAALAGAAELSTGALCQVHLAGRGKWSMLVTKIQVGYTKKATTKITFTCSQGEELSELLDLIVSDNQPQTLAMLSVGRNSEGIEVSRVEITWSFKKKS